MSAQPSDAKDWMKRGTAKSSEPTDDDADGPADLATDGVSTGSSLASGSAKATSAGRPKSAATSASGGSGASSLPLTSFTSPAGSSSSSSKFADADEPGTAKATSSNTGSSGMSYDPLEDDDLSSRSSRMPLAGMSARERLAKAAKAKSMKARYGRGGGGRGGGGKTPREVQLRLARLDLWSVMKFSFIVSLVGFVVLLVAVIVLYMVLASLGVFDAISSTVTAATRDQTSNKGGVNAGSWFSFARVFGYTALMGTLNVLFMTALSTVGAWIYNLASDLVGGIEVTLKESE